MRILAFSDWRTQKIGDIFTFIQCLKDPVDLILYGGDDIGRFEKESVNYFDELSKCAKQRKILAVIGNDDFPEVKRVLSGKNVHDLHEEPFIFQNFCFIGLEASTSGPAITKYSEREVKEHLARQLHQAEGKRIIILSHTPPYGILDLGIRFAKPDEGSHHIGSKSLRNFIKSNRVSLVVCGHCHSHGGLSNQYKNATVVNVSSHDFMDAKGNFAIIEIGSDGRVRIEWHDTLENLRQDSLMRLHSIGTAREARLSTRTGIKTIQDLANVKDLKKLAKKSRFSELFLRKLQLRAKSLVKGKIYQVAHFSLATKNPIFFDIETDDVREKVWLIGVLCNGTFKRFYADNWEEERKILKAFLSFLEENPDATLISFSGTNFDKNVVLRALNRLELDSEAFFAHTHVDLCQSLRRSFIFPNQSFKLKDLGAYLKYPFKHPDLNGFLVALQYQQHVNERKTLDPRVFDYNEDDVKAVQFILKRMVNGELDVEKEFLQKTSPKVGKEISDEVKEEIDTLRKLRSTGYTLQQLANRFNKSLYYIYSRLNAKYRPWKEYRPPKKTSKDELILIIREYYEKSGKISIRIDKRYNSYNVDLRFYAKNLEELDSIRETMAILGFNEGTPYQFQSNALSCSLLW